MRQLLLVFQFLTIIPLRVKGKISEKEIGKASAFFPLVGVFQGALLVTANFILIKVFPVELTNGLLVLLLVLSNGGFHLDGLADTFDAIAAKGDKEKKLSIMKGGTIGPVGVIVIVLTLLLKFLALNSLSNFSLSIFHLSLFLMPILPKWTMVISMFHGKPAREEGLGRIFINRIGFKEVVISTSTLLMLLILPLVFFSSYISNSRYAFYAVLVVTMYFSCRMWVSFFNRKFGGLTGDTLGAISEITEIIFLLTVIVWSRLFI
ncbi:MAG: adenosylcobinamide-GDP ribazoletransferase [Thermodesulfovibrionales bacterium]|nr:adenosylcobinamide-GDP ribazoletransferase [Thermodesulfovibrionales bacterium]